MIIDNPIISGSLIVSGTLVDFTQTDVISGSIFSGSFVGDGSQLSGVTSYTDSDTLDYINSLSVISGSAQIASDISGAFNDNSASFSTRITNNETITAKTLISGSDQLAGTTINGDLTLTGILTAQELHTEFISASVTYSSGSNQFGALLTDTHQFTGSLNITGSLGLNNYTLPESDGSTNHIIFSDGNGNLNFDLLRTVYQDVKNKSGGTLLKGTPVHISSSVGNMNEVIPSSASIASTMPATLILAQDLNNDEEGLGILSGFITGVDTSAFSEGDVVYVGSNGGYTNVKPTGNNLIQNLGVVIKVDATNGSGLVYGVGRTNDVPNLLSGEIFHGNVSNQAEKRPFTDILSGSLENYTGSIAEITVLNGNVGIGAPSPDHFVHVKKDQNSTTFLQIENSTDGTAARAGLLVGAGSNNPQDGYFFATSPSYTGVPNWADSVVLGADNNYSNGVQIFSQNKVSIQNVAGTDTLSVKGSKVGIGTKNPTNVAYIQLHLSGSTTSSGIRLENYRNYSWELQSLNTDKFTIYNRNALFHGLVIDTSGNVGIGTDSPSYRLDIVERNESGYNYGPQLRIISNNSTANWARMDLVNQNGTNNSFLLFQDNLGGSYIRNEFNGGPITFWTKNTTASEKMRIASDGKVGIGTDSPNAAALLQMDSTSKGFLPPRMTSTNRDNIISPPAGLIIYNTTTSLLNYYNGSNWMQISGSIAP